jgi:DNA repair exonuclease SbcCD nuclease subunit
MARFILTGDPHFRSTNPRCRVDDYHKAALRKWKFIGDLAREKNAVVLNAGDLFDRATGYTLEFLNSITAVLPQPYFGIAGQHDMPDHSYNMLLIKTAFPILQGLGYNVLSMDELYDDCAVRSINYGQDYAYSDPVYRYIPDTIIMIIHRLVSPTSLPGSITPIELLKKYPQYKYILSGDNHTTFYAEYEGRFLFNPGSIMRMSIDQIKHEPQVVFLDTEKDIMDVIKIPVEADVLSEVQLLKKVEVNTELANKFLESLGMSFELDMDFKKAVQDVIDSNSISKRVILKLKEAIK